MFGRKKKEKKANVKTYIDGVEQDADELEVPRPAESTALEPLAVQEPPTQQEQEVVQFDGDCIMCFDYGFYADSVGVWHPCPRCNPKGEKMPSVKLEKKKIAPSTKDRPSKGNLYEFRVCPTCEERTEVHKKKVKWQCDHCGTHLEG